MSTEVNRTTMFGIELERSLGGSARPRQPVWRRSGDETGGVSILASVASPAAGYIF